MEREIKLSKFAKYAWFVLGYNLLVIIWGVFLRASLSGDGCGEHWLTCGGEVIPSAPQLKTQIEFFHRITSSLAGIFVIGLLISSIVKKAKEKTEQSRLLVKMSILSLIFIIIEGVVGGLLVLTGNTAANWTPTRPYWMAAHLINTFTLIAVLSLTAWFASGGKSFSFFKAERKVLLLLIIAIAGIFIVGMSGSMAALSSMLYPSSTLAEGIAKDFSASSHYILRLRVFHPLLSVLLGLFLIGLAGWLKKQSDGDSSTIRWANILSILVVAQFISGIVTILTLAPIVMSLIHLLLADAVWIALVLMTASFLSNQQSME
ncbi:MAG: COX15/CtaA family protein [Acidobacteriota bacterium]